MSQQDVMDVAMEEDRAIAAGNVDRFLAVLADDCVMMPPNARALRGGALKSWMAGFLDSTQVESLSYVHGEVIVAGDWAWHEYACQWKVQKKADGSVATPRFKGLHVMRREDGWKIVRNIWNLDP